MISAILTGWNEMSDFKNMEEWEQRLWNAPVLGRSMKSVYSNKLIVSCSKWLHFFDKFTEAVFYQVKPLKRSVGYLKTQRSMLFPTLILDQVEL